MLHPQDVIIYCVLGTLQTVCTHNARFIAFLERYKQYVFTMLDLLRSWNVTNSMFSQC